MEDRGSSRSDLIKDHGEPSPLAVLTPLAPGRGVLFPPSLFPPCSALLPPVIPHSQEDLWQLPGRLRESTTHTNIHTYTHTHTYLLANNYVHVYGVCVCVCLGINPSLWDKEDVCHWLHWAQREYSLLRTERGRFEMNGRALCLLTKEDFRRRCPDSGDVQYELLSLFPGDVLYELLSLFPGDVLYELLSLFPGDVQYELLSLFPVCEAAEKRCGLWRPNSTHPDPPPAPSQSHPTPPYYKHPVTPNQWKPGSPTARSQCINRFLKTPQEIKRHRADRLDSADSPEHTHTPSHTLRRDFSEDGLELSPEYSPPISNP
ncbi:unnamed protein product [Coregonus sp. 'balchen']|nr:unnamed protein product [Coregonus sp. 'balchen']